MPFSHHSHSGAYCRHGHGTLEAVVHTAIAKGFHTYGLSEHMPRFRQQDLYDDESGLTPADLWAMYHSFVVEARRLQVAYCDKIALLVGCESDWITSDFAGHVRALIDEFKLDYFVGSVHHVHEIPIDFSRELFNKALNRHRPEPDTHTDPEAAAYEGLFLAYYDAQFAMLQALRPPVIGHFDLIKMYVPAQPYTATVLERIDRNVQFAVSYGALFELNSRAFAKKIPTAYPMPDALERIKALGGRFTLSDDCHKPDDVGMHYDLLLTYMKQYHLTEIYYLKRMDNGEVIPTHEPDILNHPFFVSLLS